MDIDINVIFRNDGEILETPLLVLTKEERTAVLIGMIHIAQPSFFEEVLGRLNAYERMGFAILYEDIEQIPKTSEGKESMESIRAAYRRQGLVDQMSVIKPREKWLLADFPRERLVLVQEEVMALPEFKQAAELGKVDPDKLVQNFLQALYSTGSLDVSSMNFVSSRDEYAAAVILDTLNTQDVATFWGASHLRGIAQRLMKQGYQVVNQEWLPAINKEKLRAERG